MLCVYNYSREYINDCRSKADLQLLPYKNPVTAAGKHAEEYFAGIFSEIERKFL
jgi:hypothetical protein